MGTIKQVDGNAVSALLNGDVDFLIHVSNCQGRFNSGVAKEVRERVPNAYLDYMNYHRGNNGGLVLGEVSGSDGVINLHAQEYYGYDGKRYLNYGALSKCLSWVNLSVESGTKIAVPYKMGSDRAGGDWEIVKELVEFYLSDFDIVYYKL